MNEENCWNEQTNKQEKNVMISNGKIVKKIKMMKNEMNKMV